MNQKGNAFKIIFIIVIVIVFIFTAVFIFKQVYSSVYEKVYQNQVEEKTGTIINDLKIETQVDLSNLKGTFKGKLKWSGNVHITGDVVILDELNIEPGTTITFAAHTDQAPSPFDIEIKADGFNDDDPTRLKSYANTHSSIFFVGSLQAKGSKDNPIIFTSDAKNPHYADWGGINLVGKASQLENVVVEYSRNGISIPSDDPEMVIRDSTIRHAMWGCFSIDGSNGLFENNLAEDCGHEGFDVGGSATVRNNKVIDSHASVVVLHGSPTLSNNIFQDEVHSFEGVFPILQDNIIDDSLKCNEEKRWSYENYHIPCFGEPYISD